MIYKHWACFPTTWKHTLTTRYNLLAIQFARTSVTVLFLFLIDTIRKELLQDNLISLTIQIFFQKQLHLKKYRNNRNTSLRIGKS